MLQLVDCVRRTDTLEVNTPATCPGSLKLASTDGDKRATVFLDRKSCVALANFLLDFLKDNLPTSPTS